MMFREERGIDYCGLACVLCGYDDDCPGCKKRIADGHDCSAGKCAMNRRVMAVGTIELFNRKAADYFNNCGILRLDLSREYECAAMITEILSLLLTNAFVSFDCTMIATKTAATADERMKALDKLGFRPVDGQIVRGNSGRFDGFWILER